MNLEPNEPTDGQTASSPPDNGTTRQPEATPSDLSEFSRRIAEKRASLPPYVKPKTVKPAFEGFKLPAVMDQTEVAEIDQRLAAEALEKQQRIRKSRWNALMARRGKRYSRCTLENFQCDTRPQEIVVSQLKKYAATMKDRLLDGGGVMLWGPKGTGKDHLLAGLADIAVHEHGLTVGWENGVDLFRQVRDRMNKKESEASLVTNLTYPSILWISDPLPPFGDLSDYRSEFLFSVIDSRYSRDLPTWITINVSSAEEAEVRMGPQVVDRLRHFAMSLWCNWPSFRK